MNEDRSRKGKYRPRSWGAAVLGGRCPHCRTGYMFQHPIRKIWKFDKTFKKCPHCDFVFEIEPGFWYGAMYVSYALNVGLILTSLFVLMFLINGLAWWIVMLIVAGLIFLSVPVTFRLSRVLYLYLFGSVKYDPKAAVQADIENLEINFKKTKKT